MWSTKMTSYIEHLLSPEIPCDSRVRVGVPGAEKPLSELVLRAQLYDRKP
jgi:hypothetical protein